MKNAQNNPFRILCDTWLARIGSVHAWFWLGLWVMMGVVGLGDLLKGTTTDTTSQVMPFVCFGLAAAHVPLLIATRRTKRLIRDFRTYCPVLAQEPDKSVSQLADTLNRPMPEITSQLEEMCRRGYFNGYLDHQMQKLMFVAAQTSGPLHVVSCPGCGASNTISAAGVVCRYCGSPLKAE